MPDSDYLLFTGKKLYWKTARREGVYINKYVWSYAKSGLGSEHPKIERLIRQGRTGIEIGGDYTDPKYQHLHDVGPIPASRYLLPLTKSMIFDKTNRGWGAGGWAIYPENWFSKQIGFLEVWSEWDLPLIRSGFFLHHDADNDGTSGCIGISEQGIKNLKGYLIQYHHRTGHDKMSIIVDYNWIEK